MLFISIQEHRKHEKRKRTKSVLKLAIRFKKFIWHFDLEIFLKLDKTSLKALRIFASIVEVLVICCTFLNYDFNQIMLMWERNW